MTKRILVGVSLGVSLLVPLAFGLVYRTEAPMGQDMARETTTSDPIGSLTCRTGYVHAVVAYDAAGKTSAGATSSTTTSACPARATLTFVSPTASTVSGVIPWEVRSSVPFSRITFSIDGGPVRWTQRQPPYVFNGNPGGGLDTTTLTNGTHTLRIDGYDAIGAKAATATKTIIVANCSQTLAPGADLTAAIMNAAGGSTICLSAGTYQKVALGNVGPSSDITIQPVPGATVSITNGLNLNQVSHLRFTGITGTLNIQGMDFDPLENQPTFSNHLTFDHINWTYGATVRLHGTSQAILFDHDVFDNLPAPLYEGRLTFRGYDNSGPVGATVSNSHFAGGCADGIQVIGDAYGVQIGPGNEFTALQQSGCDPDHSDPVQLYGSTHTLITGNYFHDNVDGSGGIMAPDGSDHETIVNNVFVVALYPYYIQLGSAVDDLVAHNTFIGGDLHISDHKPGNPPTTGLVFRDNIVTGSVTPADPGYTEDHNLCPRSETTCASPTDVKGSPVFVGGAHPTSYQGYRLVAGSSGKGAASDGTDMGIG